MIRNIFKYKIQIEESFTVDLPKNAEIISLQSQYYTPCIWALVNKDAELEKRRFVTIGTGQAVDNTGMKYIGTYQLNKGTFIGHVFELLTKDNIR